MIVLQYLLKMKEKLSKPSSYTNRCSTFQEYTHTLHGPCILCTPNPQSRLLQVIIIIIIQYTHAHMQLHMIVDINELLYKHMKELMATLPID